MLYYLIKLYLLSQAYLTKCLLIFIFLPSCKTKCFYRSYFYIIVYLSSLLVSSFLLYARSTFRLQGRNKIYYLPRNRMDFHKSEKEEIQRFIFISTSLFYVRIFHICSSGNVKYINSENIWYIWYIRISFTNM